MVGCCGLVASACIYVMVCQAADNCDVTMVAALRLDASALFLSVKLS